MVKMDPGKSPLRGTGVAMYIVGQERRLVNPPSQVVAGVRTVTTNMDGRDKLPRMSRPFAFLFNPTATGILTEKLTTRRSSFNHRNIHGLMGGDPIRSLAR